MVKKYLHGKTLLVKQLPHTRKKCSISNFGSQAFIALCCRKDTTVVPVGKGIKSPGTIARFHMIKIAAADRRNGTTLEECSQTCQKDRIMLYFTIKLFERLNLKEAKRVIERKW